MKASRAAAFVSPSPPAARICNRTRASARRQHSGHEGAGRGTWASGRAGRAVGIEGVLPRSHVSFSGAKGEAVPLVVGGQTLAVNCSGFVNGVALVCGPDLVAAVLQIRAERARRNLVAKREGGYLDDA